MTLISSPHDFSFSLMLGGKARTHPCTVDFLSSSSILLAYCLAVEVGFPSLVTFGLGIPVLTPYCMVSLREFLRASGRSPMCESTTV